MEPLRKKYKKNKTRKPRQKTWNPAEWLFLLGTRSHDSPIKRAFVNNPLGERQVIKLIFQFQALPLDLMMYQAPRECNEDQDGRKLPQFQDDGRFLIFYYRYFYLDNFFDSLHDCDDHDHIHSDSECSNSDDMAYEATEVYYDPQTEEYEISEVTHYSSRKSIDECGTECYANLDAVLLALSENYKVAPKIKMQKH
jgi:hypothetical protein